jgi:Na+-transporting NADH:ubiquinone oxidoreductase subunit NqrE
MKLSKKILAILLSTVWISLSEFVRNQLLLKSYWTSHYKNMGLVFPTEPINGAIWGVWSLVFAIVIFILSRSYKLWQTTLLSWVIGFLMMWLVIGNLGVLPYSILYAAIPLSLLEAFIATVIVKRVCRNKE